MSGARNEPQEMAARLVEKLEADSEAPDRGHPGSKAGNPDDGGAPAKMATPPDAPPGVAFDSKGNPMPLEEGAEDRGSPINPRSKP